MAGATGGKSAGLESAAAGAAAFAVEHGIVDVVLRVGVARRRRAVVLIAAGSRGRDNQNQEGQPA